MIVAKLSEELAVVGNGVVDLSWNLDCLALLILHEVQDMSLGLFYVCWKTDNLNTGLTVALSRNIDRDLELGFKVLLCLSSTTNEGSVLISRDFDCLGGLAIPLENDLIHSSNNLVNDIGFALKLDSIAI